MFRYKVLDLFLELKFDINLFLFILELLTLYTEDIACPFNNRDLETQANTEEWNALLPSPFHGLYHTLSTSVSESTRNENSTR